MTRFRSAGRLGIALLATLAAGASVALAFAQTDAAPAHKSVYGKLRSVNKSRLGVFMTSDSGEQLAWRFTAPVIAEIAHFEPGSPMIVIYRQTRSNEKSVTAVAFPGSATAPIYVNMTGERVVLRSGPMVNGACGGASEDAIHEASVAVGALTEVADACWCCSPMEHGCDPANKSGIGRALLVQCYK